MGSWELDTEVLAALYTTGRLIEMMHISGYTRDNVAHDYAMAMIFGKDIDWEKVNHAIMNRWSKSALVYIKTKAWKERDEWEKMCPSQ